MPYNINLNVDIAPVLHLIGTALLHAYRRIYLSVPGTLEATDVDIAETISMLGKCEEKNRFPVQELDQLDQELFTIRRDEEGLESASPWCFRSMKQAFLVKARAKRMRVHVARMAVNVKFRTIVAGVKQTLSRTATKTSSVWGPIIDNLPLPQAAPHQPILEGPSPAPKDRAEDPLLDKPCSCATVISDRVHNIFSLITTLSQGILDAQTVATTPLDLDPSEIALAQLVVDMNKGRKTRSSKTTSETPEQKRAVEQALRTLFPTVPTDTTDPTDLAATQ